MSTREIYKIECLQVDPQYPSSVLVSWQPQLKVNPGFLKVLIIENQDSTLKFQVSILIIQHQFSQTEKQVLGSLHNFSKKKLNSNME